MSEERNAQCLVIVASPAVHVRKRWKQSLSDICIIHEAHDLTTLKRGLESLKPSVLLLDEELETLNPPVHLPELSRLSTATRIVMASTSVDGRDVIAVLRAGASGSIHTEVDAVLLRRAVEAVRKGEIWAPRNIVPLLLHEIQVSPTHRYDDRMRAAVQRRRAYVTGHRETPIPSGPYMDRLTVREQEIAQLVASGGSNKEIASRLHITESTVKAHLTAIFRKIGVPDRLGLALFIAQQSQLQQ